MRTTLNRHAERSRIEMEEYLKVEKGIETQEHYSYPTTEKAREEMLAK